MATARKLPPSHPWIQLEDGVMLKVPSFLLPDRSTEFLLVILLEVSRFNTSGIVCWRDCWIVIVLVR